MSSHSSSAMTTRSAANRSRRRKCIVKPKRMNKLRETRSTPASHPPLPSPCFLTLPTDVLEKITHYLDTDSCLKLLRCCKAIYNKLTYETPGFWRELCRNENFNEYAALRNSDEEEEEDDEEEIESVKEKRLSWSGEPFHDVDTSGATSIWRKIYLRGTQMRRNICNGRFELWRLFLTDTDYLPVKKMTHKTTFRELRAAHRKSPFNVPDRRVRINRYWNEDYLIAVQNSFNQFSDIFVWGWRECQNPKFLYTYDLKDTYMGALFPTAFFLWKKYLVLMPQERNHEIGRSMIRTHDLSQNMKLVASYDLPEQSPLRRHMMNNKGNEAAHLHKLHDKAVALCRTPNWVVFIFDLPDCNLLQQFSLASVLGNPSRPLEVDDLDQRFLMRDNTMMFMFHDTDFFSHLFNTDDGVPTEKKYGRLLLLDFDKFVSKCKNNEETSVSDICARLDEKFDTNDDCIEKVSVVHKGRLVCVLLSGKVVIRDIIIISDTAASCVDRLSIQCPGDLQEEYNWEVEEEVDTDGPSLCTSRNGDNIAVMRHFIDGRRIHCYNDEGTLQYEINLDSPLYKLDPNPSYVSVDMDGNFLCAADMEKIVVWNSRTGKYIRTLMIPSHYNVKEDVFEMQDKFCWKGHTDFAFAEDGIIIIHSQRNFPIAADVMLFW